MSDDRMDEFIDEFLERFKKATGFDFKTGKLCASTQPTQGEPLIQGYTAEQWQEIIDGGYLCEFSDDHKGEWYEGVILLERIIDNKFHAKQGSYIHCRPAQLKGVMRPIFVEPVDGDVYVVMFDNDDTVLNDGHRVRYSSLNDLPNIKKKATKYIEV